MRLPLPGHQPRRQRGLAGLRDVSRKLRAVVFGSQLSAVGFRLSVRWWAASIQIEANHDPYLPGYIDLTQGSTLKLHGDANRDSVVDGVLLFLDKSGESDPGTLIIMNDLTVDGIGSINAAGFAGATHIGVIKGDPGASTPPVMTITRDSAVLGVKIHGGFDLEVELVNDGFVVARGVSLILEKTLTLKGETKSGSGTWGAGDFGNLAVDVDVTGSAAWEVPPPFTNNPGTIIINDALADSGDVKLVNGAFSLTENFCTTGELTWTGGKILVDEGASPVSAEFSMDSCP